MCGLSPDHFIRTITREICPAVRAERSGNGARYGWQHTERRTTDYQRNSQHSTLLLSVCTLNKTFRVSPDLRVIVSGDTSPVPSLSILPNASRTNSSLSPLNRGLVASSSACHGATPLASPPPPPARRGPPSVSRWVNRARTSAVVSPALDEESAAFRSPNDRNPSLFLLEGIGRKWRLG